MTSQTGSDGPRQPASPPWPASPAGSAKATRRRVLAAAQELGYVVNASARAMVAHRTYTFGSFDRDAATPFYGNLLTAMQERAAFHGYRVVTATRSGRFEGGRRVLGPGDLAMLRVEALIVCSGLLPSERILSFAERLLTNCPLRKRLDQAFARLVVRVI